MSNKGAITQVLDQSTCGGILSDIQTVSVIGIAKTVAVVCGQREPRPGRGIKAQPPVAPVVARISVAHEGVDTPDIRRNATGIFLLELPYFLLLKTSFREQNRERNPGVTQRRLFHH